MEAPREMFMVFVPYGNDHGIWSAFFCKSCPTGLARSGFEHASVFSPLITITQQKRWELAMYAAIREQDLWYRVFDRLRAVHIRNSDSRPLLKSTKRIRVSYDSEETKGFGYELALQAGRNHLAQGSGLNDVALHGFDDAVPARSCVCKFGRARNQTVSKLKSLVSPDRDMELYGLVFNFEPALAEVRA